jgi:tetratricopeptide (TPR) repeat protein
MFRSILVRRWKSIAALVFLTLAGVAGAVWYQERPLREARGLLEAGEARAALRLVDTWERTHGANGKSQALRARCYVAVGRYSQGIDIFESAGAQTNEEMHDWARAYLHLQQWSRALPLLEHLRTQDPENANVLHELASCRAKLGMHDEALASAREFASHEEFAHRGWLLIGMLLREKGNKEQARDAWEKIAEYDPEYQDLQIPPQEFLTQFASLQIELGNLEPAGRLLDQAFKKGESADTHFQAGLLAELQGRPDDAERHWQLALELDFHHANARESLARLAIASQDGEKARQYLSPLLQTSALRSSTTYLMQRAAYLLGEKETARQWQELTEKLRQREKIDASVSQLLRERPKSYWANVVRAYRFAEAGNWEQAGHLLESLTSRSAEPEFVRDLKTAVAERKNLPPVEQLPIKLF